uniref:Uncharacterized protein n=1 Tax=Neogobius melanostomus TaxID=47308 RepID=A0A8C6UUT1_9GOBI
MTKCNLQLRLLTEDPQNKKYPLNFLDFLLLFCYFAFCVKAPPETQMQVTEPRLPGFSQSTQGPIDVFLCPEDSSGVCSPVTGSSPLKPNGDNPCWEETPLLVWGTLTLTSLLCPLRTSSVEMVFLSHWTVL